MKRPVEPDGIRSWYKPKGWLHRRVRFYIFMLFRGIKELR